MLRGIGGKIAPQTGWVLLHMGNLQPGAALYRPGVRHVLAAQQAQQEREKQELEREQKMQTAMLTIKKKFGKNAILRGMNLEEGATAKDRNGQIGGHRA